MIVEARIEIPMGSQNKYEIDEVTGKIHLDRVLSSSSHYPMEYGYIENTLSGDGDPLDILVLTTAPTFPGCYVSSRIIGGMNMIDSSLKDTKLVAVNATDPRYNHIQTMDDLGPHMLIELENFFSTYKSLQGKQTKVLNFFDGKEAEEELAKATENYKNKKEGEK